MLKHAIIYDYLKKLIRKSDDLPEVSHGTLSNIKAPPELPIGTFSNISATFNGTLKRGFFSCQIVDCFGKYNWREDKSTIRLLEVSAFGEQPAIDKYSDEITNMIKSVKFGEPLIRTSNIEQSTQTTSKSDVAIEPVSVTKEVQDNCDASYPDFCIASPPPNLNCPDIPQKRFTVSGSDPHEFDRDNDGIGRES